MSLLSLCFSSAYSEQQKAALLDTARLAVRRGTPWPWLAWALVSRRLDLPTEPWKRLDTAEAEAKAIVRAASAAVGKRFEDLRHVVDFAAIEPDRLPARLVIDGRPVRMAGILRMATTWPNAENPEGDGDGRPIEAVQSKAEVAASQSQAPTLDGARP